MRDISIIIQCIDIALITSVFQGDCSVSKTAAHTVFELGPREHVTPRAYVNCTGCKCAGRFSLSSVILCTFFLAIAMQPCTTLCSLSVLANYDPEHAWLLQPTVDHFDKSKFSEHSLPQ